jgi:hypothetical protein
METTSVWESRLVKCPNPTCSRTFACDACLHVHLVRTYNVRWVDAFGPTQDAWVEFCDGHEDFTPSMLGA